jgi:hypothetical protein
MNRFKILSGLLLVFLSGACIGAVGGYLYTHHKIESLVKSGPPPEMMPRLMRRLARELALTPSERNEMEPITRDMMAALSELRRRYHPELENIMESHFQQMKDKLPPEKGRKLEAVRARLRRWGHKSSPPRPHRRAGAERIIGLLRQELDLSPEQMLRVLTLFRERLRQERMAPGQGPEFANAPAPSIPDRRPLWPELETDLQQILTPEQMIAFERLKAEGRLGPGREINAYGEPPSTLE